MKKSKILYMTAILLLAVGNNSCSSDDDVYNIASHSLYAIARQSADAPIQYQAEMALFSINDIKNFNTETGELTLQDFVFDTHLFSDIGCQYRVYFYSGDDLLFDARAVSWFSSAGYFNDLTFQCDIYGPDETWDASKSHFYLRYGYPGTIQDDESIEELKKKNADGMKRFINILRQSGKIIN